MRMQIMGARWTPKVNMLLIECECRTRFEHPADRWQVRCPLGHVTNLGPLREAWLKSFAAGP